MGDVTNFQVLVTNLLNPATNYFNYCYCFFLVLNVNVIIQLHSLGSLGCPGTDVYIWSTYIQSPFFFVLHVLSLTFFDHLAYICYLLVESLREA